MRGARRSLAKGCPVSRDTPAASSSAGSTPYRRSRHRSRGTGTITASGGTRGAIAWARRLPAATTPRYLRWWTKMRATPSWTKAERTTPAPARYRSGAGRSCAAHRPHSAPDPTARHPKQIMASRYGTGMTDSRLSGVDSQFSVRTDNRQPYTRNPPHPPSVISYQFPVRTDNREPTTVYPKPGLIHHPPPTTYHPPPTT